MHTEYLYLTYQTFQHFINYAHVYNNIVYYDLITLYKRTSYKLTI